MSRVAMAALAASYGIAWLLWDYRRAPTSGIDFDQLWYAATALRHGLNPYSIVGPSGPWYRMPWPLYYPMPAILMAWPLSWLPLLVARCVFVAVPTAILAYGITKRAWWPLLIFLSGAYIEAARLGQWSILLACALLYPIFAATFPAKPTAALICASGVRVPRRSVALFVLAGWTMLVVLSFAVFPSWLGSWFAAIHNAPHIRPMLVAPGGVLLLLGGLRWRRPEGRMIVAYAIVPHLRVVYEALPLLLFADTRMRALLLALGSTIVYAVQAIVIWPTDPTMVSQWLAVSTLVGVYLPALVIALRHPNVATHFELGEDRIAGCRSADRDLSDGAQHLSNVVAVGTRVVDDAR